MQNKICYFFYYIFFYFYRGKKIRGQNNSRFRFVLLLLKELSMVDCRTMFKLESFDVLYHFQNFKMFD